MRVRGALRDKIPIREIPRRTGLSRNTIRKYLRADIVEPSFRTPSRSSKLDTFAMKLSGWLLMEQRKSRKGQRTAKQLQADLVQLGFDFTASEINESLVRQLHRCEFMDAAENVVLTGGSGTGKSHVATVLGIQAIEHHRKRVRFYSTVALINALEQEKAQRQGWENR